MKLHLKPILSAIAVAIVLTGVVALLPAQSRPQPASAAVASDKYDGDCTGQETEGRCADKCPVSTDKGAYHLQGYDKTTGAAICGFTYYNECPYFAGAEAGTPECEKGKPTPEQLTPWNPSETPAATEPNTCSGK